MIGVFQFIICVICLALTFIVSVAIVNYEATDRQTVNLIRVLCFWMFAFLCVFPTKTTTEKTATLVSCSIMNGSANAVFKYDGKLVSETFYAINGASKCIPTGDEVVVTERVVSILFGQYSFDTTMDTPTARLLYK